MKVPEVPESFKWSTEVTSSTISESSISFLESKLKNCLENHPTCSYNSDGSNDTWYPSRLLEIQETLGEIVSLRDRSQIQPLPYCSLSHCWGGSQPTILTTNTEASLRAGISIGSLPKTFREAIEVCRKFGIRYIWIDSVCIRQDDLDDWHREAATMRKVYSRAIFNIAATNAMDSSIGLSFCRNPRAVGPFWVDAKWPHIDDGIATDGKLLVLPPYHWIEDVEIGALNKRAWVLQERFLSSRTMHFSYTQVFWECCEEQTGEIFGQAEPGWEQHFGSNYQQGDKSHYLKRQFSTPRPQTDQQFLDAVYDGWYRSLSTYSRCAVTKEKDKLVAIQGIVQRVARATGDRFVAGLWQNRFLEGLLWIPRTDILSASTQYS